MTAVRLQVGPDNSPILSRRGRDSTASPCRVFCCRLCLIFAEEEKQAWKEVARHSPLSAGPAGPAGAAQEEQLPGLCCWTASPIIRALPRVCTYVVSEYDSMTPGPSYLAVAGRLARRQARKVVPALQLLRWGAWLDGRAAAAGSRGSCLRSQECSALTPCRVVDARLCVAL